MDAIVVGIDASKNRLDVAVRPTGETFVAARDGDGAAALVGRIGALDAKAVAFEAAGGLETVAAAGLAGAGLPVVVVDPAQVRAFAAALGRRAKTSPIGACPPAALRADRGAALIARFAAATAPPRRRRSARCRTPRPGSSPIRSPGGAGSWR